MRVHRTTGFVDAPHVMALAGRAALVTGGARIGASISLALARAGAAVAVTSRSEERTREFIQELNHTTPALGTDGSPGPAHVGITADLGSPDAAETCVRGASEGLGRLDILVNNAGVCYDGIIARCGTDHIQKMIKTNLEAPIMLCRAAAKPMMRQRGGVIINIGSVIGTVGHRGQAAYSASKAGLTGLTLSLSQELGGRGVRVNQISPGYIQTDMTADLDHDVILGRIPLGRLGAVEDVASLVCFLAGPGGSYITGQVIAVDGGLRL